MSRRLWYFGCRYFLGLSSSGEVGEVEAETCVGNGSVQCGSFSSLSVQEGGEGGCPVCLWGLSVQGRRISCVFMSIAIQDARMKPGVFLAQNPRETGTEDKGHCSAYNKL